MSIVLTVLLSLCSAIASASNRSALLVSVPIRGRIQPLLTIAQELANKGYTVTLASCTEAQDLIAVTNYNYSATDMDYVALGTCFEKIKKFDVQSYADYANQALEYHAFMIQPLLKFIQEKYANRTKASGGKRRSSKPVFDVLISDSMTFAGFDAADAFRIPLVVNNPHFVDVFQFDWSLTAPATLSWVKDGMQLTLIQRLVNLYHRTNIMLTDYRVLESRKKLRSKLETRKGKTSNSKHISFPAEPLQPLMNGIVFVNSVFGFDVGRKIPSNLILTGPLFHKSSPVLASRLQEFLDSALRAKNRVIYVYLGDYPSLSAHQMEVFLNAIVPQTSSNQPKHQVLLSLPKHQKALLPESLQSSIHWNSFYPQMDVLSHAAVTTAVFHCGSVSVHEALYQGKTVLCLPSSVDQFDVAVRLEKSGSGLYLDADEITDDNLRWAITQVVYNDSILEQARKTRALMRSSGGVKQIVKLIDIRVEFGAGHLIPQRFSMWRSSGLDMMGVYIAFAILLGFTVRFFYYGISYLWTLSNSITAVKNADSKAIGDNANSKQEIDGKTSVTLSK